MKVWMQEMTWEEIQDYLKKNDIVIVPIGSTEQHGPHLPIGCDSLVAIGLAEETAKRTQVIVTPPTWFGDSPHHMAFPGTISLRSETIIQLMKDICKSLIHHGFKKIIVINGHRGANIPALKIAMKRVKEECPTVFMAIVDPFDIGASIAKEIRESAPGEIFHAEELETSHLLYLYPNLVHMEKAKREFKGWPSKFIIEDPYVSGDKVGFILSAQEEAKITKSGIIGDPTKASKEKGERYHKALVNNIVEFIQEIKKIK